MFEELTSHDTMLSLVNTDNELLMQHKQPGSTLSVGINRHQAAICFSPYKEDSSHTNIRSTVQYMSLETLLFWKINGNLNKVYLRAC